MQIFRSVLSFVSIAATAAATTSNNNAFRWSGLLPAGQRLEIRGVNGSIHAEASTGRTVDVSAAKNGHLSDPDKVRIVVVENGRGITVCAVYAPQFDETGCTDRGATRAPANDVEVDFTVRVPSAVKFTARTVNGDVVVRKLDADVDVHTVNGKVDVSTMRAVDAETVNGSIHAALGATAWAGRKRFVTVNGGVDLELPYGINADLFATTLNGKIATDFPAHVSGNLVKHEVHRTLGSGGRGLSVYTTNGSIRVHRFCRRAHA